MNQPGELSPSGYEATVDNSARKERHISPRRGLRFCWVGFALGDTGGLNSTRGRGVAKGLRWVRRRNENNLKEWAQRHYGFFPIAINRLLP